MGFKLIESCDCRLGQINHRGLKKTSLLEISAFIVPLWFFLSARFLTE